MSVKYLSTSALARELSMPTKDLFQRLLAKGYIQRDGDSWALTDDGKQVGGVVKTHPQHGVYIAWEESMKEIVLTDEDIEGQLMNATALAKHFQVSKFRVNPILSELGLVQKGVKGWVITKLGESIGGKQFEHPQSGVPYVCWDERILTNKRLLETMQSVNGESTAEEEKDPSPQASVGFREKFEAKHRSADGHYVRSRAEMLIDNWLYMSEIVHAYERKLPVEEEVYCDFYLPVGKVYIEYWGLENDERYKERKRQKVEIYAKYGFNLIEIEDADIQNLDDILPKKLLKFGIQAY
ncbi:glycerol kinase [Paenibacillus antri]|uniref:Glycerol kinase n=1 Tax=Paenibacillus antri TaxID=2582848 RepID=A0A5R9GKK7_9BACL|nr:glycerol kinase [Paenibacillus antri]TLS54144.1 glycerol kinase [Paenibacillus antri]